MNNKLPNYALRFLKWYCPTSLHESIEGDLVEQFEEDLAQVGLGRARLNVVLNVIRFFRPSIILRNKFSNSFFQNYMFKNYLKIAFRSLWRAKAHSLINVLGLGLGIASCMLISLYVRDEITFDTFHLKAERIYRVYAKEDWGEKQQFFYTFTPFPIGPALKENLPEVESQVRINNVDTQVMVGENHFNETVVLTDEDFFKVFDFDLIVGEKNQALRGQNNVVLTKKLAEKYFGASDPINKTISIQLGEQFEEFTIVAVAANPPTNSSIQFDILISSLNFSKLYGKEMLTSSWFNIIPETYVLLQEGAEAKAVEHKFPSLFKTLIGEEKFRKSNYAPGLQPLTDIHLNTDFPRGLAPVSNPRYSYILSGIALLILFVACINFVTLSVGRSMQRAKEVGVRKVVGAMRTQLITQFIGEAVIVTLLALLVGVGLLLINLPLFNDLSGKQLLFPVNQFTLMIMGLLLVIIGLISGSYPALVLSALKPITILKGSGQTGKSKQNVRSILVGIQLMLSVFLISSTLLMREQLSYLQNKNMGFDKAQLIAIQLNAPRTGGLTKRIGIAFETAQQFKNELSKLPDILAVSAASHDFGNGGWMTLGFTDEQKMYRTFNMNVVDEDYISMLKIQLVKGRNFYKGNLSDKRRAVIVNEAFEKEYGWADAVGKKIPGKNFQDHEIIGVVKDFNYASLYTKVEPLVIVEDPAMIVSGIENFNMENSPIPKLLIRLKPGNMAVTIDQIKQLWNKIEGEEEFSFVFVDQTMAKQYRSDQNLGKIVSIATLLSVIIGSLGLYALASLTMQQRIKEISIRKVMGASENSLLLLLSKEYLVLQVFCLFLSIPITWYLMSNWLSTFEYRIPVTANAFALAGVISLVIALATISFQLFKIVWTNPAKCLKYE